MAFAKVGAIAAFGLIATVALATEPEGGDIKTALRAENWQEARRLIDERLAHDANDPVALHGLMQLALDGRVGGTDAQRNLLPKLEACINAKPKSALCQLSYGNVLGAQAMSQGMMAAMRSVGKIKGAFLAAVEADPNNFEARDSLVQFYLMAPGVAGGSVKEAKRQAEAFAAIDPVRAHFLQADIANYEDEPQRAQTELSAVKPATDEALRHDLNNAWIGTAYSRLHAKDYATAQALFGRLLHEANPIAAQAHFGLGRVALAQSKADESIAEFNQAMALDRYLNVHYRMGRAFEAKGDKTKAAAEYEAFLNFNPAPTGEMVEDARKRVKDLKS
jgi:tetratricopeptide (TPR) repeat protein